MEFANVSLDDTVSIILTIITLFLTIVLVADKKLHGITLFNYLFHDIANNVTYIIITTLIFFGSFFCFLCSLEHIFPFLNTFNDYIIYFIELIIFLDFLFIAYFIIKVFLFFYEQQKIGDSQSRIISLIASIMMEKMSRHDEERYFYDNAIDYLISNNCKVNEQNDITIIKKVLSCVLVKSLRQIKKCNGHHYIGNIKDVYLMYYQLLLFTIRSMVNHSYEETIMVEIIQSVYPDNISDIDINYDIGRNQSTPLKDCFFLSLTHAFFTLELNCKTSSEIDAWLKKHQTILNRYNLDNDLLIKTLFGYLILCDMVDPKIKKSNNYRILVNRLNNVFVEQLKLIINQVESFYKKEVLIDFLIAIDFCYKSGLKINEIKLLIDEGCNLIILENGLGFALDKLEDIRKGKFKIRI